MFFSQRAPFDTHFHLHYQIRVDIYKVQVLSDHSNLNTTPFINNSTMRIRGGETKSNCEAAWYGA